MTSRARHTTASAVQLADAPTSARLLDSALGWLNRAVLGLLGLATLGFSLLAISGSSLINSVSSHHGPLSTGQRATLTFAALITGTAAVLLRSRLRTIWRWAELPAEGTLWATKRGLRIRHAGVLDGEVLVEWPMIRAISIDSGRNHDDRLNWRRFPLPSPQYDRRYLFDTAGEARSNFALIAGRPVAPNIAVLLHAPIELRNPNHALTEMTFPKQSKSGLPAHAPNAESRVTGLFLRASDVERAHQLLMRSGKVRSLRNDDLATVS
jgi:hypothetical protein